jgi:hypothetical protein
LLNHIFSAVGSQNLACSSLHTDNIDNTEREGGRGREKEREKKTQPVTKDINARNIRHIWNYHAVINFLQASA